MKDDKLESAKAAFSVEAVSLIQTMEEIDWNEFGKVVKVLAKAPRIAASGCGHSGIACQHFAHLMCCIERPARFLSPAEAVHGGMGFLQENDVMILVSRGGKTDELLPIAEICRQKKVILVTVTENTVSPLAQLSDFVIPMVVTRECDKYNSQGTTSFVVTNAIFDALQTAVLEETNFQNSTFAMIHPAGAVGKRLNSTEKNNKGVY